MPVPQPNAPAAASATASPTGGPLFAQPTANGPSLAAGPLLLPGTRGPWTYMISPAKLVCRRGRVLPAPAKAWHEAGFGGNGPVASRGEGAILAWQRRGFVKIEHNVPAVAFGQDRSNAPISSYLDRHEGVDDQGRPAVYFCDAWERPDRLAHMLTWKRDAEGRDRWLEQQLLALTPELSDTQIRLATEPVIALARQYMGLGERGEVRLRELLVHLPLEHTPRDLLLARGRLLEDDDPDDEPSSTADDSKPTRRRAAAKK